MQESLLSGVRNLIFDLGGVLYDVDYRATETAISLLREPTADIPVFSRSVQTECFTLYETGQLTSDEFRSELRSVFGITASNMQLDAAWCAILTGVYPGRTELLGQLRKYYRMALLSNTNAMHLDIVQAECPELLAQFDACFYSHELMIRKPQQEIFEHVLEIMDFRPEETLFLDDSRQHLQAADALGIHTMWVRHPEVVETVAGLLLRNREQ